MGGSSSRPDAIRYLVRCAACDRAFWLAGREEAAPEHSAWERHPAAHRDTGVRCPGSRRPGHWIGEGDGSVER